MCVCTGLETCGSVWSCAVCSGRVCRERTRELTTVLKRARARGWRAYLLTLTVPHGSYDALRPLRAAVAKAWQRVQAGKAWVNLKKSIGVEGYVRALEVTTGRNGWHPHLHVILITRYALPSHLTAGELSRLDVDALALIEAARRRVRGIDSLDQRTEEAEALLAAEESAVQVRKGGRGRTAAPESIEGLTLWLWRRWSRAVQRLGCERPSYAAGVRVDSANNAAQYLAKMGLTKEIVRSDTKEGRAHHLTHWQLLQQCGSERLSEKRRRYRRAQWQEWVESMHGARQLTWAHGLREKFGLGPDVDDEAIAERAAAEAASEPTGHLRVDGRWFDNVRARGGWRVVYEIETATQAGDRQALAAILERAHSYTYLDGFRAEAMGTSDLTSSRAPPAAPCLSGINFDPWTGEVLSPRAQKRADGVRRRRLGVSTPGPRARAAEAATRAAVRQLVCRSSGTLRGNCRCNRCSQERTAPHNFS